MMKFGITLFENRVSPRWTAADSILLVSQRRGKVSGKKRIPINIANLTDLSEILIQNRVDILVCGGITSDGKLYLQGLNLSIIDNVAGTAEDIEVAIKSDRLRRGYGFIELGSDSEMISFNSQEQIVNSSHSHIQNKPKNQHQKSFDCLACTNKICLDGKKCEQTTGKIDHQLEPDKELLQMLEAATDIACEKERTLCRLSELIYFCLEMQYKRLGIAYCVDLEEPTEILVRLLRRFFDVYPVCCKVGGSTKSITIKNNKPARQKYGNRDNCCNPWGQAQVLNNLETDFNIMVGLCMGADCVFIKGSLAPTTGLFIKDKSLANNPIGAIYSEYYLKEAVQAHR
ncbi:MAG: DUF1847 domain-containing protein [candidate division Zixibacteria bacterium]|nr:DUF1847 domain-containing protein [candidate division Zixibacteria bacterium]